MADANSSGKAWFVVEGVIRKLHDYDTGEEREYVVLGNNFRESLTEVQPTVVMDGDSMLETTIWTEVPPCVSGKSKQ